MHKKSKITSYKCAAWFRKSRPSNPTDVAGEQNKELQDARIK